MMDRYSQVSQPKRIFKSWKHTLTISNTTTSHFPCQTENPIICTCWSSFTFPVSISHAKLTLPHHLYLTFFLCLVLTFFAFLCLAMTCHDFLCHFQFPPLKSTSFFNFLWFVLAFQFPLFSLFTLNWLRLLFCSFFHREKCLCVFQNYQKCWPCRQSRQSKAKQSKAMQKQKQGKSNAKARQKQAKHEQKLLNEWWWPVLVDINVPSSADVSKF